MKTTLQHTPTIIHITPRFSKPPQSMQKLQDYLVTTITDKKQSQIKDKLGTLKIFTSYKCKWIQPENQNYTVWMTIDKVFPHNKPNIANHNLLLLKQYYLTQHKHYLNIIEKNNYQLQSKDTRYIYKPLNPPLIQINLAECNLEIDINNPTHYTNHTKQSPLIYKEWKPSNNHHQNKTRMALETIQHQLQHTTPHRPPKTIL
jgi:hypothetical protein